MWDLSTIWDIAQKMGAAGFVLAILLWLDERRERRQIQQVVRRMHQENTKYLKQLLRKKPHASAANGRLTAGSRRNKRRGMQ